MVVPAASPGHLGARDLDYDDVLRACACPSWSATAARTRSCCRPWPSTSSTCATAEASWYDGVGHVPFLESAERFNDELTALTRRVGA